MTSVLLLFKTVLDKYLRPQFCYLYKICMKFCVFSTLRFCFNILSQIDHINKLAQIIDRDSAPIHGEKDVLLQIHKGSTGLCSHFYSSHSIYLSEYILLLYIHWKMWSVSFSFSVLFWILLPWCWLFLCQTCAGTQIFPPFSFDSLHFFVLCLNYFLPKFCYFYSLVLCFRWRWWTRAYSEPQKTCRWQTEPTPIRIWYT